MQEIGEEGRLFRANPEWELQVWERLSAGERELLATLQNAPGFYGILRPQAGNRRALRAVDRDTALLFLTLREPAPLPAFAAGAGAAVADLVTEGVLEVWDGAAFRTGGAGAALLLGGPRLAEPVHGPGRLSLAALRYAAALQLHDAQVLAARLYAYNRLPLTAEWSARVPDARGVLRHLALADTGPWQAGATSGGAWIQWTRRGARAGRPTHKLYVSPRPESLPAIFPIVLEVLERAPVLQFKLGGDAAGLLRPDKLVVYFADAAALAGTADALARRLEGVAAHGVPFTASIDDAGLLSWGADPPPETRTLAWLPGESWRSWLARELASGLLATDDGPAPIEPVLDRLSRRGVDVERWVPSATVWRVEV